MQSWLMELGAHILQQVRSGGAVYKYQNGNIQMMTHDTNENGNVGDAQTRTMENFFIPSLLYRGN